MIYQVRVLSPATRSSDQQGPYFVRYSVAIRFAGEVKHRGTIVHQTVRPAQRAA